MKHVILLTLYLTISSTFAQVGINTDTPSQTLDVNGQIQVGEDSAATNEEGAIRYNSTSDDFEGYNGSAWQSFTARGEGIPSNAQFVSARINGLAPTSSSESFTFRFISNAIAFSGAVPSGKYLLVTGIHMAPNSLLDIDTEEPLYALFLNFASTQFEIRGKYTNGGALYQETAAYAPLAVVRPGTTPTITNFNLIASLDALSSGVDVTITGFLVDDTDFN